jgi:hypothetical protein
MTSEQKSARGSITGEVSERLERLGNDALWLAEWIRINPGNDACNLIVDEVLMFACVVYGCNLLPHMDKCRSQEDCGRVYSEVVKHFQEIGGNTVITMAKALTGDDFGPDKFQ